MANSVKPTKPSTTLDFSKVFASNSSIQPFKWPDSEYLAGWEAIKQTPPARQQFDALQSHSDKKENWLYNQYLEGYVDPYLGYLDTVQESILADLTHYRKKIYTPAFNTRDEITTSGTYTAPETGWYKITLKGGGAGGQGAFFHFVEDRYYVKTGFGGGEGGTTIAYKYISAGTPCAVVIGAGGTGGTSLAGIGDNTVDIRAGRGGNTSVTIGSSTYTAGGGGDVNVGDTMSYSPAGGSGTIPGAPGGSRHESLIAGMSIAIVGGAGGGAGGGTSQSVDEYMFLAVGKKGGGGAGGGKIPSHGTTLETDIYDGGDGGNGFVWFEYWAE